MTANPALAIAWADIHKARTEGYDPYNEILQLGLEFLEIMKQEDMMSSITKYPWVICSVMMAATHGKFVL